MSFDVPNSPTARYHRDAMFRALVDTLELHIEQARYTPTELREAALLAAIHYEMRKPPRPIYLDPQTQIVGRDDGARTETWQAPWRCVP